MNLVDPLFLDSNRVPSEFVGGRLLEEFAGMPNPVDGEMPEDWLLAIAPHPESQVEPGRICDEAGRPEANLCDLLALHAASVLGSEHVASHGPTPGFDFRLLDVTSRRPACCNVAPPDAEDENAGVEAWTILATREIDDQVPAVLLGFEEKLSSEELVKLSAERTGQALAARMHVVPVSPGETYLVPAGMPYALGPGVFLARTRPEGLQTVELADDASAVRIETFGEMDLLRRCRADEMPLHRSDEGAIAEVIGSDRTRAFTIWQVEVAGRQQLTLPREFGLVLCEAGEGRMHWAGGSRELIRGECFLQPHAVPWIEFSAYDRLRLLVVLPPSP